MLTFDVKRKINTLRDILVGKVPDPKAQVEQITIALIYKFMDDMDIEGLEFGGTRQFFTGEYEKYAWTEIMKPENSGQQRAFLYAEGIEKMATNPNLPQLFRDIFRGAYIPYRDPDTLNMFLKEVSDFSYDNSEDLGNAFEYLLSIMGSQGDAGQFRTPRHIIDMMVEIIDPKKNETILDPACGTAGFLISAYRHILAQNKDEDGKSTLTADDRKRLTENFAGYDISPDMVRLSRVNMYLHHFTKPKISEYDTLTSEEKWDDCYDVILANPPFMTPKGGIMPHSRYRVKAKRSEVLFVDYIAEHLNPTGRAAIIVPEGIVFQSANAYKELRKYLVDDGLLYAVISLPVGIFNPYSGVKTSILLIDKSFARLKDEILFVKLNNDGFDLGAQRREIEGSEIPEIIRIVQKYHADFEPQTADNDILHHPLVTIASKERVAEQDYILVGERYKVDKSLDTTYPVVPLSDICEINAENKNPTLAFGDDEFIYIDISSVENGTGKVDFSNKIKGTDAPSRAKRAVKKGDILFSTVRPKYRAVNNNNLDALRSNKLFFSKASSYDDPFDTFLHIDVDKIRQEFNRNYSSPEALAALANGMKETFQNQPGIPQEFIQQVTNVEGLKQLFANGITKQFLSYVLTLRSKIQDEILSICFSENGFNETLWLKYADMHKGFCLMYDLSDADSSHCGKLDKCVNCGVYKYGTRIYPVYYSNTPHDATNFAKFVMGLDMIQQLHVPLPDFMQEELKPLPWEIERNSLIKKECHKYDEEWRMLANCKMNLPAMIEYVPAGVIIGLRTPPVDKNLIISMAKEAGVKNIYQSYIDEKNRLNAYLLKDV